MAKACKSYKFKLREIDDTVWKSVKSKDDSAQTSDCLS